VSGLLIGGRRVDVAGVDIISPDQEPWAHLTAGDGRPRPAGRVQQAILHKTIADDPEKVVAGEGPVGLREAYRWIAEMWARDPAHSGAHLVTSHNGHTACLEDLELWMAWHAHEGNGLSYGHEICEAKGGVVYQAALDAAVAVTLVATRTLGIQWQCPHRYTDHRPLARFIDGGSTLFGVFGHRDVTTERDRKDPGDEVFAMLERAGFERFDFAARQDLDVWAERQRRLKSLGHYDGVIDGLPGPKTTRGLKALGFPDGIFALWPRCAGTRPV
jgi:hypothetical protein